MIRALVIDDEPAARERVRTMLESHDDFAVIGECSDGIEARETITRLRPDVIFLDIEMPRLNGIALLEGLHAKERPVVLLITAHSRHAVEAFDLAAADYLLKPFTQERFDRAVQRARRAAGARNTRQPEERLAFKKSRGKVILVRSDTIRFVAAEGNYSRIYTTDQAILIRETIQSLEQQLDPATFIRVHRAAIVNIKYVIELHRDSEGRTAVVVSPANVVPVGPKFRGRVEQALAPELTRLER
jgi:two-component system LytT family response regulator